MFPRAIPFVAQMEAVECGAACLTMVLRHFGHHAELAEVREAAGVSRDGVNAKSIVRVAREYGLTPRASKLEPEGLAGLQNPAILHWQMNHFVVLRKWTPAVVHLLDPAIGPREVSPEDFDRSFTGICIELSPGERFTRRAPRRLSRQRYLGLLRGARDAVGAVLLASLMVSLLGLATPLATQVIADQVLGQAQTHWLAAVGLVALGLVLLNLGISLVRARIVSLLRVHLDSTLGVTLVRHLLTLPIRFFTQRYASDLVSRVQGARAVRELLAGQAVTLLVDAALLGLYLLLVAVQHWWLGAILAGACGLYVALYLAARGRQEALSREQLVKELKSDQQLLQTLKGIQTIKSSGREYASYNLWLRHFVNATNVGAEEARMQGRVAAALLFVRSAAPAALTAAGAWLVVQGRLSLGALLGVQMLQASILGPLERVIQTLLRLQQLPLQLERMDDVFQTAPEPTGTRVAPRLEGDVALEGVTFRYGPTAPKALDAVHVTIRRGEKVAFVGPSGSGKSTVARLLLGLYPPSEGRVLVDGHDLAALDASSVRRQIGVVLQETSLFEGTVRENISLYHPSAPLEDVVAAARVAQIHDDILALPQGYDTAVAGSGGPLSGGQRQRLALARAILHRPAIMVLDEATSALDAVTEAAVERYLASRRCTRIVIAHRLSTVRDADRIFVMRDGRVVEEGRHDDLVAARGLYAELVAKGEQPHPSPAEHAPRSAEPDRVEPQALDRFPTFAVLPAAEKAALAALLRRQVLPPGTTLAHQGERAPGLFLVESGGLDVVVVEPGLAPFKVDSADPGEVIGELSLLDGLPVAATLTTQVETRVLHLSRAAFEDLREAHDAVALALLLRLGALAAERLREVAARRQAYGAPEPEPEPEPGQRPATGRVHEAALRDLPLGAALTPAEETELRSMGRVVKLRPGEVLFRQGDPGDRLYVVLGGRIAVVLEQARVQLKVERVGEVFGELGLFDAGPRAASCVADGPSVVFGIEFELLRDRLRAGDAAAWKTLRHVLHGLAHEVRLSTIRLREAIAASGHEADAAFRAREEARRLARATAPAPALDDDDDRVPHLEAPAPGLTGVACVAAVLRWYKRAVPVLVVQEACTEQGAETAQSLPRGAEALGFTVRPLTLTPRDYAYIEPPMLLACRDGGWVVCDGVRRGGLALMDPARGRRALAFSDAAEALSGAALEVRPGDRVAEIRSLAARVLDLLRGQRRSLAILAVTTVTLQAAALATPALTAKVIDSALPAGDLQLLGVITAAIVAAAALQALATRERHWAVYFVRTHLDGGILRQLFRYVLRLPIAFFERHSPGALFERFDALRALRTIVTGEMLAAMLDLPVLLLSAAYLAALDGRLVALVAAAAAVNVAVFALGLPRLRALAVAQREAAERQRGVLLEVLSGIVALRVAGDDEAGQRRWLPTFWAELRAATRQEDFNQALALGLQALRGGAVAGATWWGASRVLAGALSLGDLMAFTGVAGGLLAAIDGAMGHVGTLVRAREAVVRVDRTFAETPEQTAERVYPPGRLRGRITLEGVSFGYEQGAPVLHDVSLEIAPGSKVALVGASGSGKSTLGKLLLGFYLPQSGRVLFDGRDLRSLDLPALRAQIGVVLQEAFLFTGSVRDNLTINAPGAPLARVVEAAERAAIHATIDALPMKYETVVAEGGATFSGGQRQRLALARALVHGPAVLLLDEATSALDNLAQAAIEASLARLSCTRIVIAHRLSTVMDADQIVVIQKGRVVEVGRHAELVARQGCYYDLVRAQLE